MPIREGWELSPDRKEQYDLLIEKYPVGEPILISKCRFEPENGLMVVSDNGFAWRMKAGFKGSFGVHGKYKWIRWHDFAEIKLKKKGQLLLFVKKRKNGELILNRKGQPKTTKYIITLKPNQGEEKSKWKQRREGFYDIITEIYNRNKGDSDPPTSDTDV